MMILPLISAGLLGVAAGQASGSPDQLSQLFMSACFDGSVRLSSSDAVAVPFNKLPGVLRAKLSEPEKAQVWQLRSGGDSYLYILDYGEGDQSSKICGVASNALPVVPAIETVAQRVGATVDRTSKGNVVEWWVPEHGYVALASRLRSYTVLQVTQLTNEERKEVLQYR